jgi:lambda repressor-like predicted transcriptional regulator
MSKGESKRFVSFLFTKSNAFDIFFSGRRTENMDVYLKRSEKVFDGKKVREKRKEKGYSLRTLSAKSGLSMNTVRSIESMVKPTNVENLVIIADVLNCSIQDFCVFVVSLRLKDRVDDEIIAYRAISNGENL